MANFIRTLRCSAWLGWQIESNWTDVWRFAIYLLVKPICGSMLLVCMYWAARAASSSPVSPEILPFLYLGNACYLLVGAVTFGLSWAVITDREHYGMLKYVYISPVRLQVFFIGRGLARSLEGLLGALLTVGGGLLLFPELRSAMLHQSIAWSWLAVYLALGIAMLIALGLVLAAAVLNLTRHGMFLSEGVAGVLYLLSGAVFPIDVLPSWMQSISLALPVTYWLEGMRRALLGGKMSLNAPLASWNFPELAFALAASTFVLGLGGHLFFGWSERRAWHLGKLDETTGI